MCVLEKRFEWEKGTATVNSKRKNNRDSRFGVQNSRSQEISWQGVRIRKLQIWVADLKCEFDSGHSRNGKFRTENSRTLPEAGTVFAVDARGRAASLSLNSSLSDLSSASVSSVCSGFSCSTSSDPDSA